MPNPQPAGPGFDFGVLFSWKVGNRLTNFRKGIQLKEIRSSWGWRQHAPSKLRHTRTLFNLLLVSTFICTPSPRVLFCVPHTSRNWTVSWGTNGKNKLPSWVRLSAWTKNSLFATASRRDDSRNFPSSRHWH
jgi:hypothetical protein